MGSQVHKSRIGLIQSCQTFSFCEKRNIPPLFTSPENTPKHQGHSFPSAFKAFFLFAIQLLCKSFNNCAKGIINVQKVKSNKKGRSGIITQPPLLWYAKLKFTFLLSIIVFFSTHSNRQTLPLDCLLTPLWDV